jgi:hypothetical protein
MPPMEFNGEFETHITVRLGQADEVRALRAWGAKHDLKCLHILLDRGQCVSQPMLTRRGHGMLSTELATATQLSRELGDAGFEVTRIKIEAGPTNRDVPQTDTDAIRDHRNRYFEHHIKLLLDPLTDIKTLTQLAERHFAHLSRNVLRVSENGGQERFVTQRCYSVGRVAARQFLDDLLSELEQSGYRVIDVEEEFVVHDSNAEVDAGWIQDKE